MHISQITHHYATHVGYEYILRVIMMFDMSVTCIRKVINRIKNLPLCCNKRDALYNKLGRKISELLNLADLCVLQLFRLIP